MTFTFENDPDLEQEFLFVSGGVSLVFFYLYVSELYYKLSLMNYN